MLKRIYIPILLAIFTSSLILAQGKVLDKSGKKPSWVDGMSDGYIIASGTGDNVEDAKQKAMVNVKSLIVASVADYVNTSTTMFTEEVTADKFSTLYENFTSLTTTQSGKMDYLQGVSPSKVEDFYWEKLQDKSSKNIFWVYHVKYPFTRYDLEDLVNEFKVKDAELTKEMEKSLTLLKDFESIEQLIQARSQLEKLLNIFIDERRAKCETGIETAKALLKSVYIADAGSSLGMVAYTLQIGKKSVSSSIKPKVTTNCADITDVSTGDEICMISYGYDGCYDEPGNNIKVQYMVERNKVEKVFGFDIKGDKAKISLNGSVRIADGKCTIPVKSEYPSPFKVSKVILEFNDGQVIEAQINDSFSGKGQHEIKFSVSQINEVNLKPGELNGYIYYGSENSSENLTVRLYKQKYSASY